MYNLMDHTILLRLYMEKFVMVGPDKPAIPVQRCFGLVSSHQQGIRVTCLAHHPALYTPVESECLWFCVHEEIKGGGEGRKSSVAHETNVHISV